MNKSYQGDEFSTGWAEDAYNDGTASSDLGPMPLMGIIFSLGENAPPLKERTGCRHCGKESVDRFTTFCAYHQSHHEKRMAVRLGLMSDADYQAWYRENPAT
jgi:hypothetical protein